MKYKECEILIIEDNPNDAELIVRSLKKNNLLNNINVIYDGEDAMEYLFNSKNTDDKILFDPPKVILLDLKLPKVSGLEILEAIKSDQILQKIPVVVVTSSKEDPDIDRAYKLGVNSYVVKPINFNEFVDKLSQIGIYWLAINEKPKSYSNTTLK
ncbi:response regulator [Plebeiibacterium sediminum]|uniref:Response regulator n=1 Tax=Plebeiibacterium sediminum TaxID=2992112 RepID=A0AAE3SGM9_9BACT|nr:response regulator [Plebeiobacterium sediminum]MCW3787458.1 response regulator [Plebeiobacterium sediminum]